MRRKSTIINLVSVLFIMSLVIVGCAPAATQTAAPAQPEAPAQPAKTDVPAAPATEAPQARVVNPRG